MTAPPSDGRSDPAAAADPEPGPESLRHYVLAKLRPRIVSGQLEPGTRLLENDLAAQMGTSRGPVREALRTLEQEGLVEFFPRRGAVVVGVPEEEIAGVYELRAVIEARAFLAAANFINKRDIANLTVIADDYEAAFRAEDIEQVAGVDHRFHNYILELSGLVLLRRIWDGLDGLIRVGTYRRLDRPGGDEPMTARASSPTHRDLLEVLAAGREAEIGSMVVRHILNEAPGAIDPTMADLVSRT